MVSRHFIGAHEAHRFFSFVGLWLSSVLELIRLEPIELVTGFYRKDVIDRLGGDNVRVYVFISKDYPLETERTVPNQFSLKSCTNAWNKVFLTIR